jgi:hypothetical protein
VELQIDKASLMPEKMIGVCYNELGRVFKNKKIEV